MLASEADVLAEPSESSDPESEMFHGKEFLLAHRVGFWYPFCQGHPGLGFRSLSIRRLSLDNMQDRGLSCYDNYTSNVRSFCLKLQSIINTFQARVDAVGRVAEIVV